MWDLAAFFNLGDIAAAIQFRGENHGRIRIVSEPRSRRSSPIGSIATGPNTATPHFGTFLGREFARGAAIIFQVKFGPRTNWHATNRRATNPRLNTNWRFCRQPTDLSHFLKHNYPRPGLAPPTAYFLFEIKKTIDKIYKLMLRKSVWLDYNLTIG
jgi:hypothetical protein